MSKTKRSNLEQKFIAVFLAMTVVLNTVLINNVTSVAATKASITLSSKKETIATGKSVQLKVKSVKGLKSKAVIWKSSNSKVAKVTSKGKVTGVKQGSAKITATSKSNKKVKATCKITVKKDAVQSIQLNKTACVIVKGKNVKVKVNSVLPSTASSKVTWKINKSSIAKVTTKGNTAIIKGKKAGKAALTATAADGSKKTAKVDIVVVNKKTAIKKINEIKVSLVQKEIYVGDTIKAKTVVSPSKVTLKKVLWSSDNEEIAEVDQTGKITALKAGTVKIIASAQDGSGKKGTVTLVIKEKPQPTAVPTKQPEMTGIPTAVPTKQPEMTAIPTAVPTKQSEMTATPTAVPTKQPEMTAAPTAVPTKQPEVTATPTKQPTAVPTEIPDDAISFVNANELVIDTEEMNCDFYVLNKEGEVVNSEASVQWSYDGEEYHVRYPYPLGEEFILRIVKYNEAGNEMLKENHILSYNKVPVIYAGIGGIDGNCIRVDIRLKSKEEDISNVTMTLMDKNGQAVEFELEDDQVQGSEVGSWWEHGYYLNLNTHLIKDEPYTLTVSAENTGLENYSEELVYASKGYITGTFVVRDIKTGEYVEAVEPISATFYQGNKQLFTEEAMRCQTQEGEIYYEFVNIPVGEYKVRIITGNDSSAVIENLAVEKDTTTSLGEVKTKYDVAELKCIDEANVYLNGGSRTIYVRKNTTKNQLLDSIKVGYFGKGEVVKEGKCYTKEEEDFELISGMQLKEMPEQEYGDETCYWEIVCLEDKSFEYIKTAESVWSVSLAQGTEEGTVKLCNVKTGMRYVVSDSEEFTGEETIIEIISDGSVDNIKAGKFGSITIFVGELTKDNQYRKCYSGDDLKWYIKKQPAPEEGIDYIIDYINETIVPAFAPGEKRELEYGIGYSVDEGMKKFEVKDGSYVATSMDEFVEDGDGAYGPGYFMIRFAEDKENVAGEVKKIEPFNSPTEAEQILEDAIYNHNTSKEGFFDYQNQKTKVAIPGTVYYTTSSEGFSETSQWIQGNNEVIDIEPGTVICLKRMSSQEEKKFEYHWRVPVPEHPSLSKATVQMTSCYRKDDGNWYFNVTFKNLETNLHHIYCFSDELITDENAFDEMKMYYLEAGAEKTSMSLLNDDDSRPKYCYMKSCSTQTNFESKWTKLKEVSGDNEFGFDDIP